ncbi:UNVERIFIED_ORG: Ca2+-binding RTX toxin-like protein [Rhizobium esperanzae]
MSYDNRDDSSRDAADPDSSSLGGVSYNNSGGQHNLSINTGPSYYDPGGFFPNVDGDLDDDYSDDDDDDSDDDEPVVLDLDGNGIKLTQQTSSITYFDMAGDGKQHLTAWAAAGDGVLAIDANGDGKIDQKSEIDFTAWDTTATTDMQALRDVFDTNHNGKLDAGDSRFADFKVVVTQADGTQQLKSLADLGITSIDLISNNQTTEQPDGSKISGTAAFSRANGSTGTAADVSLAFDKTGVVTSTSTTHLADGSTMIDTKASGTDGALQSERILATSADGLGRTLTIDIDGDGIIDQRQTDVTVIGSDGSRSETLSDSGNGGTILTDSMTTATSADGKLVTISRDQTGGGHTTQRETDATAADGTLTVTVTDLNADGSEKDRTTTITSADGLSKTQNSDSTGRGIVDGTTADMISVAGDGTRTEDVSDYAGTSSASSSRIDETVTVTSGDGRSKTITSDLDGDGHVDQRASNVIVVNANGTSTATQTRRGGDGSLLSETVTALSADSLVRATSTDADGDGTFEEKSQDSTVIAADSGRVETVTDTNADLSLRDRTITAWSADGRTRTIETDTNGDGGYDSVETIAVAGNGTITDTLSDFNPAGTILSNRTVTVTSADGLSKNVRTDEDGDGDFDKQADTAIVINADGSSTTTLINWNGAHSIQTGKAVTTVSVDGKSTTVDRYLGSSSAKDSSEQDTTVLNADGSQTRTVIDTAGSSSAPVSKTVTATSADHLNITTSTYLDQFSNPEQVSAQITAADGSETTTSSTYSADGKHLLESSVTSTSADRLTSLVTTDSDGDGDADQQKSDVTVLNADGSHVETVSDYAGTSSAAANHVDSRVTTTSANRRQITVQFDLDGDGTFDRLASDVTAFSADGSQAETVSDYAGNGTTLIDRTTITTSHSGYDKITTVDADGDGQVDTTTTDITALNSDGSTTETVTIANGATLRSRLVTTEQADGKTKTIKTDANGDGGFDTVESVTVSADGSTVDSVSTFSPDGTVLEKRVATTTSADGLIKTVATDADGDGDFDSRSVTSSATNTDGSTTVTSTQTNGDGSVQTGKTVKTISADGQTLTTDTYIGSDSSVDKTVQEVRTRNADGSILDVEDGVAGVNRLKYVHTLTTASADGRSSTSDLSNGIPPTNAQTTVSSVNADGSKVTTVETYGINNPVAFNEIKTTTISADGLTKTVKNDFTNSDNSDSYSETMFDGTVLNADGSRTETLRDTNTTGQVIDQVIKTTSANGDLVTQQWSGNHTWATTALTVHNSDGSTTTTTSAGTAISGSAVTGLVDQQVQTVSADGLITNTVTTLLTKTAKSDISIRNVDGSKTETVQLSNTVTGHLLRSETTADSTDGLSHTESRDSDGDGVADHSETTVTAGNGVRTTTISNFNADGSLKDRSTTSVSANGLETDYSFDSDGDGVTDRRRADVTVLNPDGSRTETITDLAPDGIAVLDRVTSTTSADGLTKTQLSQLDAAGRVSESQIDNTTVDANGELVETNTTYYSDGTKRSGFVRITSADGLEIVTDFDHDGDGVIDESQLSNTDAAGNTYQSLDYPTGKSWRTGAADSSADGFVINVDDDGRSTDVTILSPDTPSDPTSAPTDLGDEFISVAAEANGSYSWEAVSTTGSVTAYVRHGIDPDGIDTITWSNVRGLSGSAQIEMTEESLDVAEMQRIYDVVFDRDMQNSEREQLGTYLAQGAFNATQLATDLIGTAAFTSNYGTLSNVGFVEVLYQNAYGRNASVSEMQTWLGKLSSGSLTRAGLVLAISESAEHQVVGDDHITTNVTSGKYLHSTDKAAATETVDRLYRVLLGRDPSTSEAASKATAITGGTETQFQVANDILSSSAFTTLYGGLSTADLVNQFFVNALGRAPTTSEASFWTSALGSGTTKADLAVALAVNQSYLSSTTGNGIDVVGTAGNDSLTGGTGDDTIDGAAGNDLILAFAGNDTIVGGAGADTMVGGTGDDTYIVDNAGDVVTENAGEGTDTVKTALASYTLGANVENLVSTGTAAFAGTGNELANAITGGVGADTLDGGAGSDTLTGGAGNDIYVVDNIGDVVVEAAGAGTDTIKTVLNSYSLASLANVENLTFTGTGDFTGAGNAAVNVITGGAGNDILDGGAGADTLVGGAGNDIYIVDNTGDVVTEAASAGTDTIETALASYSLAALANVENLTYTGTTAFTGTGNTLANVISGGSGNDTLDGGAGADTLIGGTGDDTYIVDNAGDVITENAGEGTDTVKTALASYTLAANVENLVYTGTGTAVFAGTGNALDNIITGGANADTLSGAAGNDTLDGGAGADHLIGGTGDDTYVVDNASDVITENAGEGTDTIRTNLATYSLASLPNVENLTYTGTAAFTGAGNAAANVIVGGAGNDTLDGGAGADTLIGGAGNDTYIVDDAGDVVVEVAGGGTDVVKTVLASYTLGANVENLTYTGSSAFAGTGNELDNAITGGAAADTLSGDAGNDTLDGGAGADTLIGGLGDDTYIIDNAGDIVSENAGEGTDTVKTSLTTYTLGANVENLTYTGTAAFTGTGNGLDNVITGGTGADHLAGSLGNDTYIVDNAGDVVTENAGEGTDTVRTALASYTLAANVENLVYTGAAAFAGTGNGLDNMITSGAGADTLTGGAGNDTLDGGAGADKLVGGTGDDIYIVDNASDVVTENAGEGNDTIRTNLATYSLASLANVENLTYTGTAAFTGTGNASANVITGGSGNDTLDGGAGADTLIGGTGDDTYVVDNAGDLVVENTGEGMDTIKTALTAYSLGTNVENLTFTGTASFTGTGNELDNIMTGGTGADHLIGGLGNDTYIVDNAGDVVTENAGEGTDTVKTALASYTLGANVENLVSTGTAAFAGTGNELANAITGGVGADTLDGGAGSDTLTGGAGNDIYVVDNIGDVVVEAAGGGTDTIKTTLNSYSLASLANVENLTFTGTGDSTGSGNAAVNVITGGAGNDILDGGAGADTLVGGAGNDIYIVDNTGDVVTEAASAGTDTIETALASYSLAALANVENLTYTGTTAFTGTGNTLANAISGGAGNDTLDGGAGADTLIGGTGDDTYVVDNAGDLVVENAGEGTDTVKTVLTAYSLGTNVENLTFTGTASFTGTGNELDNIMTGGTGADHLIGGLGNDTYIVDNAGDVVTENAGEGTDTVKTALASYTLGANVENLVSTGTAAFAGTGNELANAITGGVGADTLDGGAGSDTLTGGAGNDIYVVDNIGDVVVEAAGGGTDTIKTVLNSYSLASLANVENLTFTGTGDFTGAGNAAVNVITGGAGNDILDGGAGADTLVGGAGNDIYIVDNTGDVVTEAASAGTDTIETALASYSLAALANVENLTYTGTTAFTGTGNTLANVISGGSGNDTLDGGAGADTLIGGTGDDTYIVDNAGDVVTENAGEGTDTVKTALASYTLAANVENLVYTGTGTSAIFSGTGNALDNIITGGANADTLSGGAGNDTLDGGAGADHLVGGVGDDTYIVDNAGDVVTENAGEGTDTIRTNLATYSLAALGNVENLTYTGTAAFTGTGNASANVITGSSGNDTLDGGAGADTLSGGAGNDTYVVDDIADVVVEAAGGGTDVVKTVLASYTLGANVENLTYTGSSAFAGTGNELDNAITGGAGADTLSGGAGNDTLDGGAGADTLIGGLGDDTYIVDNAGDVVSENAGEGTDTVKTSLTTYTLGANVENLTYTGTAAFTGSGNALDNIITGGTGADHLAGGLGNDTYIVDNAGDVVTENVGEGIDTVRTALASYTLAANVENLVYTGAAAFAGTGNGLDNMITGGAGADTLTGGAGNDTLDGGVGADHLIGGTGDDIYIVDNASDVVTENAGEGTDTIRTNLATYSLASLTNVENLTYTGTAAFTGTGNASANVITGGSGNDTLDGGAGADTLIGGTGDDTYIIDNAGDLVVENIGEGMDTIKTSLASYTLGANVEFLTYTGTAAFTGTGNELSNTLTGGTGADTLVGGGGDDFLDGGTGADHLIGGIGDDDYVVDNIGDVVTENAGEGSDTIFTTLATYSLANVANVENVTYTGTAAFTGTGNALNNVIRGGDGANILDGGAGDDTLMGGYGNDTFIVDSLNDVIIENAGAGTDTIKTALASYSLVAISNVENLTYTGTADFTGTGNELANMITGGVGNDVLDGGAGVDALVGGAGNDTYIVDNVSDVVTEAANAGIDTIKTALASYSLASLTNVENLVHTGSSDFAATGNASANAIIGGAGNDTLDGGTGADTLTGGTGNDIYVVDNVGDLVVENAGEGTDTVKTSLASYTLGANVENLIYTGTAAFTGTGNSLDNVITGGSGANRLSGGGGDDILIGGAAADTFVYGANGGIDTIVGFVASGSAHDVLAVDSSVFADWAHLLAASTQSGSDVIITADADDKIILKNVTVASLQPANVQFV